MANTRVLLWARKVQKLGSGITSSAANKNIGTYRSHRDTQLPRLAGSRTAGVPGEGRRRWMLQREVAMR
jgi:hypothetical protein